MKIILFFTILIFPSRILSAQTVNLPGPYSGEVRVIINDVLTLYAGANAGGVYKSTDTGNNWVYVGLNGEAVRSLAADGDFIAAGTDKGLFITTNGGGQWTKINTISSAVRSILKYQTLFLAGTDNGVYRSTDNGNSWTLSGISTSSIRALHVDINGIIYAGTSGQGLYRSTNGGSTWASSGISSGFVRSIKSYSNVVYASMWGGVRRSSNSGVNWTSIGLDAYDVTEIAVISNILYAATWEGVFKSENNGSSWNLIGFNESITWSLIAVNNLIVIVGRDGEGIFKTTNGGISWNSINNGLNASRVWNIHQHNEQTFFAGTSGGAYKTTDAGLSWQLIASSNFANRYWSAYSISENEILLGTSRGILRSTDTGNNWNLITSNEYSVKQIVKHSNGTLFAGTTTGVIRSIDNGSTWTLQNAGLINTSVNDMMITPNGQIYVSTSGGSGLYRSTNNGGSWSSVNVGASSIASITFDKFGHLYALSSSNLYKSTNNGTNWFIINTMSENAFFSVVEVNDSGHVFIGSTDGMYFGLEFGNEWLLNIFKFANSNILSLSSINNYVYLGTAGGGIFKYFNFYIPVELTSFSAVTEKNNVILNWTTASERNNRGYEVQRASTKLSTGSAYSSHGSEWEIVCFVEGNGTTTEINNYFYYDNNLSSGKYSYRLKQIDFDGKFEYSNIIEVEIELPKEFVLHQNFPNPFNPSTEIRYQISEGRNVKLIVYDILGNEVETLVNEFKEAGSHSINFEASKLPSGTYFYQMKAGEILLTKKMILIK